jgi:uncharacterized protein
MKRWFNFAARRAGVTDLGGNLFLEGPEGRLEAIIKDPPTRTGRSAVICHPHPLYGGTMHNKVVYRIAKAFNEAGFTTLRFNFRGVGLSAGTHDDGNGEQQDLVSAIDFVGRTDPGDEIWLAGFSFGSAVMLKIACPEQRVSRVIAVGVPVSMYDLDQLLVCRKPKLFVQGSLDQFGPVDQLAEFFRRISEPKRLAVIDGADHFFEGHLGKMADAISGFINESAENLSTKGQL